MAPIVDPSWPRMGSDMENPFQNAPGRFIYALPDLRSSMYFGANNSRVSSTTVPPTPSLPPSPLEGQISPLPCDEIGFDHDGCPDTTEGESKPKIKQEKADSDLDAKPRSDSRTHTPSPLSPTSSSSSRQERTTEKTKRSRRRRRRNRHVVEVDGCVMGPRMVHLPLYVSYWGQSRTPGITHPSLWNPGYPIVTAPGGDRWFKPRTIPGC